ncbi:hypothetical protein, partial [Pseudoalteromonas sp. S2893]|uniref:hypothetical protein n=1 Tax=Pseudoalteromonas sp. S2893 TaxID=579530 RepID=UPI00126F0933
DELDELDIDEDIAHLSKIYMGKNLFSAPKFKKEILEKRIKIEIEKLDTADLSKDDFDKEEKKIVERLTKQINIELPKRYMEHKLCYFSDTGQEFLFQSVISGKTTAEAYNLLSEDETERSYIEGVIRAGEYDINADKFIELAKGRSHWQSMDILKSIVAQVNTEKSTSQNPALSREIIALSASGFFGKSYIEFYCKGSIKDLLSKLARSVKYVLAEDKLSELESSLTAIESQKRDKKLGILENTKTLIADENGDMLCYKKIATELLSHNPDLKPKDLKGALLGIKQCNGNEIQDTTIRQFISNFRNKINK